MTKQRARPSASVSSKLFAPLGINAKRRALSRSAFPFTSGEREFAPERKAPRGGLNPNRGFVELGAFCINNLRRSPKVEYFPWNPISTIPKPKCEQRKRRSDGMERARYYQSLLDSGKVQTRAELARYLGVSRARVTQVLRRLEGHTDDVA